MRKETKIGIIIGIIIVAGVAVYFANQEKSTRPAIPDNITLDDVDKKQPETTPEPVKSVKTTPSSSFANNTPVSQPEVKEEPKQTEFTAVTSEDEEGLIDDTQAIDEPIEEVKVTKNDDRKELKISLPTEDKKKVEQPITKAVKEDPLKNLPASYPDQITETKYHVVQKGDSLYSISTEYFGTGRYWKAIYNANRDVIKSESNLSIGWKIKIPTPEEIE